MVEAARSAPHDAADEVSRDLARNGLSAADVVDRVADGRVNDVPATPTRSIVHIVRANVLTPFAALLGSLFVLILIVGPLQDALFGFVVVLNSGVGIVQEVRAKRTLDRLTLMSAPRARVVRDGGSHEVSIGEVVLDDVLEIAIGDQVVVDGEVLTASGLEIDESLLTGESDPVDKVPGSEVLSGSFAVAGSGRYRASRVGRDAYAAKLAAEARRFTLTHSELRDGVDRILKYVSFLILPTGILLFWSQLAGRHWRHAISGAVAGTVAMVPEGLVLLMSVAFAVAVVRLAKKRVLVQELPAVEVLARVDVVCIDKTGTLTDGTTEVERIERFDPELDAESVLGALAAADPVPNATMRAIAARFPTAPPDWVPTEAVAFSSTRKWSAASFGDRGTFVLGAPDVLFDRATDTGSTRDAVEQQASVGKRVILLARVPALSGEELPEPLMPVAMVVLGETIRPEAADTLRYFAAQGVVVKVISGDDPRTVGAIAGRLGLPGSEDPVDARTLPEDQQSLAEALEHHAVFGQVAPQQKRSMVAALQSRGHTVAMTGDGVNDALALKDADIGVAMGSGSDATRAVAQLVLLDSDFSTLPSVVREGRQVLGNIERTSGLYLTKTSYAMLLALATGVGRWAFPFLPRHLSLVAALTIGIPSFFLALAPNEERFRPAFVPRVLRFAIPAGALAGIATLLAYALARHEPSLTLDQWRTTAVITLDFVGLLILSIVATPFTGWRQALVWSMVGLFVAIMLVPETRDFFALRPPPAIVWLAAIGIAAVVWSTARLFVPGEEPVGPRGRDAAR
jgi:cation-transporting ATPase E